MERKELNRHAMMDTIREEPGLIQELFEKRKEITKDFVDFFKSHDVKKVYFSGHGAALNDALWIGPLMEMILKVEVEVTNPTTFNYRGRFNAGGLWKPEEMLVICPAQAGHTTGPVITARKAKKQGIPVLCFTHDPEAILAKECDVVINNYSPAEPAFVETKGHIADVLIGYLCSLEAALALGRISEQEYDDWCEAIGELPKRCEGHIQAAIDWYEKHKYLLVSARTYTAIGFAENYVTAKDGCLKLAEATANDCASYEMEEYMHGPDLSLHEDTVIFILNPKAGESERMRELYQYCRKISRRCILIASKDNEDADDNALLSDFLDKEYLTALEYIIPFQVLAHLTAMDLGLSTIYSYREIFYPNLEKVKIRIDE